MAQQLRVLAVPAEDRARSAVTTSSGSVTAAPAPGNLTCASGLHGTETHLHINKGKAKSI